MADDKVFNDLLLACRLGDIESVDKLLSTGVNVGIDSIFVYKIHNLLTRIRSIKWISLITLHCSYPVCVGMSQLLGCCCKEVQFVILTSMREQDVFTEH